MITLDMLFELLSLNNLVSLNDFFNGLISAPQLVVLSENSPRLKKSLQQELTRLRTELAQQLKYCPVPESLANEFQLFNRLQSVSFAKFSHQQHQLTASLQQLASPFCDEAEKLLNSFTPPGGTPAQHALFFQRWRLSLTLQSLALSDELLEQQRERLIESLKTQLQLSQQLTSLLDEEEMESAGRLWDLSRGQLQQGETDLLTQYAHFLQHHPQLLALAQQLGRSRKARAVEAANTPRQRYQNQRQVVELYPEELRGIHHSDDILRLLPPELISLSQSELEWDFYRRWLEKLLVSYQLQGQTTQIEYQERAIRWQPQEPNTKGPFIVCVDTSGSMGGFNERCAKGFCLALLKVALREHRACFIMLFTQEVICYDMSSASGVKRVTQFLSQKFSGGTDLDFCLAAAATKSQEYHWQEADIVVISDFIAQRLSEKTLFHIQRQQSELKQRFHAVTVSNQGKPRILKIFDYLWSIDTRLKSRLLQRIKR